MGTLKNRLIFFVLVTLVLSIEANIGEFDEVWQTRATQAKKTAQDSYNPHPETVTDNLNKHVHKWEEGSNSTRRDLHKYDGPCMSTNPIDRCWRCDPHWAKNRMKLADCVLGFGHHTTGGKGGKIYVVTDPSDNDMVNPKPGTLRHAVIQPEPLWIIFKHHMVIRLNQELIMTSNKTIDARGQQVMLFGASDSYSEDSILQITLAFNHFGQGLIQRMPRVRWGFVHAVNNDYTHWLMYAIGGSQHPTILSQGNRFIAPPNPNAKEVTKREYSPESVWKNWVWRSQGDLMMNRAFFVESGNPNHIFMKGPDMIHPRPGSYASRLTRFSGSLNCIEGKPC